MKVVLFALNGSYTHTNLAIRCLREPLEKDGFEVILIEGNLRDRTSKLLDELYCEQADVYGFSCYIWNIKQMLALASDLSGILPSCHIVFGGPEVSYDTERFISEKYIDTIICGEGEAVISDVCRRLASGETCERLVRGRPADVMRREGILYRESDFRGNTSGTMLYYESSRGCPYSCAYCLSSATCGVRAKSVAETLDDLRAFEKLHKDFRIIKFVDRTFNYDINRANAIWRALLTDEFTKKYHFEICISLLNEESFEILSQMPNGTIQLEVGLQSTNPATLDAVSRHLDADEILGKCKRVLALGNIHLHLDLIAGLPYENFERFGKSFDDAYFCCHQLQLGFLKLLYGTALRRDAEKYGFVISKEPPYTVLTTKWITYGELHKLENISFLLERYRESGNFDACLKYAVENSGSPFGFYLGLSEFIERSDGRGIHQISQPDAYRLLYKYVCTRFDTKCINEFKQKMHSDFAKNEVRKLPAFLK